MIHDDNKGNNFMSGFANDNYLAEFATNNPSQPSPVTNVAENKNAYILEIGVPGFNKEDIKMKLEDFQLTVSGDKKSAKEVQEGYPIQEFDHSNFRKVFFIADHIDKKNISGKFLNGMLTIELPKKFERKGESSVIEID